MTNKNPLIINWFVSAVVFASYNLFASIGILTPLGKTIDKRRTLYLGIIVGGIMLLLIAVSILISLATDIESVNTELPMLAKASSLGTVFQYIFAFLLFGGMFGTSVSSLFAIAEYIKSKKQSPQKSGAVSIIVASLLSVIGSMAGFNSLISIVYPLCGYFGFIGMILIAVNYRNSKKCIKQEVHK